MRMRHPFLWCTVLFLSSAPALKAEVVAPAPGHLTFIEGFLPEGGRLEIVEEASGVTRSHRWQAGAVSLDVPPTPLVLCGFDPNGRPVGFLRVRPKAGQGIDVPGLPVPPRGKGQLAASFAYLTAGGSSGPIHDVTLHLVAGERRFPPDVIVESGGTLRGFWLDVPSGKGSIDIVSKTWAVRTPVAALVPERNAATLAAVELLPKPALRVRLEENERLPAGEVRFELFPCDALKEFLSKPPRLAQCQKPLARSGALGGELVFQSVPPGTYAYRWRRAGISASGWIEVPDFADVEKTVPVGVSEISGRVARRGESVRARLTYGTSESDEKLETETDDDGHYRILLAEKSAYSFRIRTEGFPDFPTKLDVKGDARVDFDLPANRYVVRVRNAEDGKPIENVRIDFEVASAGWNNRNDPLSDKGFTGADGSFALPPVPPGQLRVRAAKGGYTPRPAEAPPVLVDETADGSEIPIALKKAETVSIRLVEPDGSPAVGGWVWTSGPQGAAPTDENGATLFDIALQPGAPFFAFDGRGRLAFTRWSGEKEQVIRIPVSGPPVTIRFQSPSGESVKRMVRVGVDDVVMFDGPFAQQVFWSGSRWTTGPDGAQIVGLPAEGMLTVFPMGRPDLAVVRRLPVTEEIVVTVPSDPPKSRKADEVTSRRK